MADALTLLENDHRKVERLFLQFDESREMDTAKRICEELRAHMKLEEKVLYPVVGREVGKDTEAQDRSEHQEAKRLISAIEGMEIRDPELDALMIDLRSAIEQHVHEEETEVFPELRERIPGELERLGREVNKFKQETGAIDPTYAAGIGPSGA